MEEEDDVTRFVTSSPTERSFVTRRSWQHPGRREFIHGRIVPLEQPRRSFRKWLSRFLTTSHTRETGKA